MSRMLERVVDFQDMGVQAIWVIDPWRRVAYTARERGKLQVVEDALLLPNNPVNIAVADIFIDLDWLEQQSRS